MTEGEPAAAYISLSSSEENIDLSNIGGISQSMLPTVLTTTASGAIVTTVSSRRNSTAGEL